MFTEGRVGARELNNSPLVKEKYDSRAHNTEHNITMPPRRVADIYRAFGV